MKTCILILVLLSACGKAPDPTIPSIDGNWMEVHGQAKLQLKSGFVYIQTVNADGTFPAPDPNFPLFSYAQDGLVLHKYVGTKAVDCQLSFKTGNDVLISCPDTDLPKEMTR